MNRGNVDDLSAATLLYHLLRRQLSDNEGAEQIYGDHSVPFVISHIKERLFGLDAGIIDRDIQSPEFTDDLFHHSLDILSLAHVGRHGDCRRSEGRDFGLRRFEVLLSSRPVVYNQVGSLGGEACGDGLSNTTACPCHQSYFVLQSHHSSFSSFTS